MKMVIIMEKNEKEIQLKVKGALQSDVGRGIVRLDTNAMKELGVTTGDVIEIEGMKKAAGLVWRSKTEEEEIIRLDGILRYNAGAGIDELVKVRKAECKPAKQITIAPTEEISYHPDFVDYTKDKMMNLPLAVGNSVLIESMSRNFEFQIVDTNPKEIVQVVPNTVLKIETRPVKIKTALGIRYEDIGGLKEELESIREMVEIPMRHPQVFKKLGISPPKGVLFYGPPGCGKTLLAKAVANETEAHFISINGPEIMSKWYGQSEENLRNLFQEAKDNAPSIIFIDEIDAIAPKRDEAKGEVERRVVSQLLTLMDGLEARGNVVVIAATNRPNDIDPALRRPGRFDREIEIRVPDADGRKEIFQIHLRGMPIKKEEKEKQIFAAQALAELKQKFIDRKIEFEERELQKLKEVDGKEVELISKKGEIYRVRKDGKEIIVIEKDIHINELKKKTIGFTGADIAALAREAAMHALKRIIPELKKKESQEISKELLEKIEVNMDDFQQALKKVEPSAMREVMVEVPTVKWGDIGGLENVKQELIETVEWPMKYEDTFKNLGINAPKGILLIGPPGCGKTLLAKAVATESMANFISIKGPEIFSKWVGESEKAVREIFKRARQVSPSIIFFDELDAIAATRGRDVGTQVSERVVDQILSELDGLEELHQVVVIAATNRPELVDTALARPGRLDKTIFVPLPDRRSREEIFKVYLKKMAVSKDLDVKELVEMTEVYQFTADRIVTTAQNVDEFFKNIEKRGIVFSDKESAKIRELEKMQKEISIKDLDKKTYVLKKDQENIILYYESDKDALADAFAKCQILIPQDEYTKLEGLEKDTFGIAIRDQSGSEYVIRKEKGELNIYTCGFSGADIAGVCREAGLFAVREAVKENKDAKEIKKKHFESALKKIRPSISPEEMERWNALEKKH